MSSQLQFYLQPLKNPETTWFCLIGEISTCTPPPVLAALLECLEAINDQPVEFVLPAVCPDGPWFDMWTGTINAIPVHLEIRFVLEPGFPTGAEP